MPTKVTPIDIIQNGTKRTRENEIHRLIPLNYNDPNSFHYHSFIELEDNKYYYAVLWNDHAACLYITSGETTTIKALPEEYLTLCLLT